MTIEDMNITEGLGHGDNNILLEIRNVTKTFPGVKALDNVSFNLKRGEIHALVGENGAGKTTLMHILSGIYQRDSGEVLIEEKSVKLLNPLESEKLGISIVHQELSLCPNLSIAENIYAARLPKTRLGFVNNRMLYKNTKKILNELSISYSPWKKISTLAFSSQQLIEIAKALEQNNKILILDEPTSALSQNETDILFSQLTRLRKQGIGIIYISHRLKEVFQISDRITVLRDGSHMGTVITKEVNTDKIISMMVGRTLKEVFPKSNFKNDSKKPILRVKNLNRKNVLYDISFELFPGEILGVSGLVGAGRTEMARAIYGLDQPESGEVIINDKKNRLGSVIDAKKRGIFVLPESRKEDGLFLRMRIWQNIVAANLRTYSNGFMMKKRMEKKEAQKYFRDLKIKSPSIEQIVFNLSGGNQQKVVLAKSLTVNPLVLIADEPTRGIDVGSKAEIYKLLRLLADRGMGIIMISSELPEILGMSDRVMVMQEGRIKGILNRSDASEENIMRLTTA